MQTQIVKKAAIAYVRVSTTMQRDEGISLEAQREKIRLWASVNDYELLVCYEDAGISGCKVENRPGLQSALADACKHKAALIVYSLSRLARSTKDAITISERLERAGADLVSLSEKIDTTTAAGKMVFRMLAVLAEFERDQISERTSAALQFKTRTHRVGELRYGYDLAPDGKMLTPNESEQSTIKKILMLRQRKSASYGTIAKILNSIRTPAKQGGVWYPNVIYRIVTANKGVTV